MIQYAHEIQEKLVPHEIKWLTVLGFLLRLSTL